MSIDTHTADDQSVAIRVNNQTEQIPADTTLAAYLEQPDYHEKKLAVAINGEFVPRSAYRERPLQDGDQIDIVMPVGGG